MSDSCDVLVIGGGPAGSTLSALLAERGWRVVLLEKDRHPRFHIGESLLPLSLPFFARLGVLQEVEKIGLRKYAAEFHSMEHGKTSRFYFADALNKSHPYAFEVRRSEFDHVLLKNAAAKGADVREGCRVTDVELTDDRIGSVIARDEQGKSSTWRARFVVDASGRDTLLADRLKLKERSRRHASAALYAHFQGAVRNPGADEGNISIYWFDHGWFWMIPLPGDVMSVGAVCWPSYLKSRQTAVEPFFHGTIALCPAVAERLRAARLISPVTATGNYSYRSKRMFGENYLLAGDAYGFIDPVFSSGVHLAMHSGMVGAEAVDAILRDPAARERQLRRYQRAVEHGLDTFSWFIYRITTPAMRDMVIHPRDTLGMRNAVVSLLAGDLFNETRIASGLFWFKLVYYIKSLFAWRASWSAHRRRRANVVV